MGVRFAPNARAFLDAQSNPVRQQLVEEAVWLAGHPNGIDVRPYDIPPLVGRIYRGDTHWILYLEGKDLLICNIGPIGQTPHL